MSPRSKFIRIFLFVTTMALPILIKAKTPTISGTIPEESFLNKDDELSGNGPEMTLKEEQEYPEIKYGVPEPIISPDKNYSLPSIEEAQAVNIVYQSCGHSLQEINIYKEGEILYTIANQDEVDKYQLANITNPFAEVQLGIKIYDYQEGSHIQGAIVGITKEEISQDDLDKFYNMSLNISLDGKKITWEKLDNVSSYDLYVLDEYNSNARYLRNPCFLYSIKTNQSALINSEEDQNDTYVKYYSTDKNYYELKEKGKYIVAVSASVEGKIPLVFIYNDFYFDSDEIKPDEEKEKYGLSFWLLGVGLPSIAVLEAIITFVWNALAKDDSIRISLNEPLNRPSSGSNTSSGKEIKVETETELESKNPNN